MRGFQPGKARAVPQNYADGGVVSTIKGMLGFGGGKKKPEPLPADLSKMPPTGAGPAASQPEPPKKAISQYSGMSALERRMKEQGLADGGLVRGPGTGISDDIEDEVEEGTFIMPADSTEAIGPEVMDQAGKAVPVNLSNGEAKLPPEALQAIGAQVMEAIKDVTHVPAAKQARGFPMGERAGPELDADDGRMNFADGGVVDDKRRPRTVADLARSPGYGAGAGGPVSTPVRPQAPAARPQAAQPVPGVTRQGNSYSAAPVQPSASGFPLGSGMYQLDRNLPRPPVIQAQAARPAAAPVQQPTPAPASQPAAQAPAQPRPTYTGSTVADRARQPGFAFAAGEYRPGASATPARPAQPAAPTAAPSARTMPQAPAAAAQIQAPATAQATPPAAAAPRRDRGLPQQEEGRSSMLGEFFRDSVSEVADKANAGNLAGAFGAATRRTLQAPGMTVAAAATPALEAAGRMWDGLVGNDPAATARQPVTPPAAPAANTVAPPAVTQAADPVAPPQKPEVKAPTATAPGPVEVMPGVFRQGNSFGDSAAAATAGAQPSQGPSARDMQAMNNLIARDPVAGAMDRALGVERDPAQAATGFPQGGARQAPAAAPASAAASSAAPAATTARGFQPAGQSAQPGGSPMEMYARQAEAMRGLTEARRALDQYGPGSGGQGGGTYIKHSGNDWETEKNLKNLRTSASSITNRPGRRGEPSVEQQAYLKALDADMAARSGNNPAAIEAMRQQGETARIGMREAGENARSGRREGLAAELGRGQLDLQRSAQGFTTRQGERQEKLYAEYDAAKTPEEQAAVARKIAALSGKAADPKDNFMVVGGGQEWDAAAGAMRNVPQRLVDLRTGQDVGATGQGGKPLPAPADPKERKVGQVYVAPNGAKVQWDGQGWTAA